MSQKNGVAAKRYFECNIPMSVPLYLHPNKKPAYQKMLNAVHVRTDKLNEALAFSGLAGPVFAKFAKVIFDTAFARFEAMSAKELASAVASINDGKPVPERMDWPNAEVVIDCDFVTRDEWESIRHFGIGGSDAAVVLDVSHFSTRRELYHKKVGTPMKAPLEKPESILDRGHFIESDVVNAFCKLTGARRIPESRMFRSKKYPNCTANIDALVQFSDGSIFVYEAKTTVYGNWQAWSDGKIPRDYKPQMRQYPAVLDDPRIAGTYIGCIFVDDYVVAKQYIGSGFDPKKFVSRFLERDSAEEQYLLQSEQMYWDDYIAMNLEPPASNDPQKDIELLNQISGPAVPTKPYIDMDAIQFSDTVDEYLKLDEEKQKLITKTNAIIDRQKQLMVDIIDCLGPEIEGHIPIDDDTYYEVKYSPRSRTVADTESMELLLDSAAAFCPAGLLEQMRKSLNAKQTTFRVFTLKKKVKRKKKKVV